MPKNIRKVVVKEIRILLEALKTCKEDGNHTKCLSINGNLRIVIIKTIKQEIYKHKILLVHTDSKEVLVQGILHKDNNPKQTRKDIIDKITECIKKRIEGEK